jgi:hypothetical protein
MRTDGSGSPLRFRSHSRVVLTPSDTFYFSISATSNGSGGDIGMPFDTEQLKDMLMSMGVQFNTEYVN